MDGCEVEIILKKRRTSTGSKEYLIKWEGLAHCENTWEPIKKLNCPEQIKAFEDSLKEENGKSVNRKRKIKDVDSGDEKEKYMIEKWKGLPGLQNANNLSSEQVDSKNSASTSSKINGKAEILVQAGQSSSVKDELAEQNYIVDNIQCDVGKDNMLLQKGADPNNPDNSLSKALFSYVMSNKKSCAKDLLERRMINPNVVAENGRTPLHFAAYEGHTKIAALLIKHHANVNLQSENGETPLHFAAFKGHTAIAKLLIKYHANVNLQSKNGETPLHFAAYKGDIDLVNLLIEHHANVNLQSQDGTTPLHKAAEKGHSDVMFLLMQHHANINLQNEDGITPLDVAKYKDNPDIVTLLSLKDGKLNESRIHINSLPEEMILRIFENISHNKLGDIARVCKQWHRLARCPQLWKRALVAFDPRRHKSQNKVAVLLLESLSTQTTHISLNFVCQELWKRGLNCELFCLKLGTLCTSLTALGLYYTFFSVNLQTFINLCSLYLKNLSILSIHFSEFQDSVRVECDDHSKIKVLSLVQNFGSTKIMLSKMPSLRKLRLSDSRVNDDWFRGDFSFLRHLQVLDLQGTFIGSRTIRELERRASKLTNLNLCSTELKDRYFSVCTFPQMKTICLRHCKRVTCERVVSLVRACPSLQKVYVEKKVARTYAVHPFVVANPSKLKIVKTGPDLDPCCCFWKKYCELI